LTSKNQRKCEFIFKIKDDFVELTAFYCANFTKKQKNQKKLVF